MSSAGQALKQPVQYRSAMRDDQGGRAGSLRKPAAPPEARMLRVARLAEHMSLEEAGRIAGISKGRWAQVENGYEGRGGLWYTVSASDGLLAHMASAVGVSAAQLEQAGRAGAAEVLGEILRRKPVPPVPAGAPDIVADNWADPVVREIWGLRTPSPEARALYISLHLANTAEETG